MTKLYTSLRTFGFLFAYLPASMPILHQVKAQKNELTIEKYDELVQQTPKRWASGILKRTKSTFEVTGLENIPTGPVLFISNHEGNFDIPALITYIPKPFGFISKIEVKKIPLIAKWMTEMNCIFFDRTDRRSAYQSINDTVKQLRIGHSILIFPEGTRNKGNSLGEFKSGFVRIAKDAKVPIVPIVIQGTSNIMEKNNNKIRAAKVQISIIPSYSVKSIQMNDSKIVLEEVHSIINKRYFEMNLNSK